MKQLLVVAMCLASAAAFAEKVAPEKIPVAFGSWKGPSASSFKSALRKGLGKECAVVSKKARVVIEGVVTPSEGGKGVVVRVVVKSSSSGEIVESREFPSPKPQPSGAL